MQSIFSHSITPLASLLRPERLDDLVGQQHLIGPGKSIRKFIEAGRIPSILLWGPPGCGKTSLARVIANSLDAEFFHLSGVLSKKEDVVKIIAKAQKNFAEGRQTILFLDEIHRWTKSQQDVLLPWVEKGIVTLIGATTENPSFTVINALLSRCRTYILEPIKPEEVVEFLERNIITISERYPQISFGNSPLIKGEGGICFREYNIENREKARKLRNEMTEAEKKLWLFLRSRDETWNRQKLIEQFIVDFYCSKHNLVIEVDGATHSTEEEKAYDAFRTQILESQGLRVVRFTNEEVYNSYDGVCEEIMRVIEEQKQNPPNPLSQGGTTPPLSPTISQEGINTGGSEQQNPLKLIAKLGNGDLRNTLNLLETACILQGTGEISRENILEAGSKSLMYDQDGEEHYNLISAMHKSLRDSDGDAAIYWIGRMLAGGEDPRFIARRMINFASEDVGLGDPLAMTMANSVYDICEKMGMPECELPLCKLAYHLAAAPKDNSVYMAMKAMQSDVREFGNLPVPLHLRNAPTELMREAGYGKGYEYAHDLPDKKSSQEHFPEELRGRKYRK